MPIGKLVFAAMVACDRPSKKASCTILNCSRGKASSAARTCSSCCAVAMPASVREMIAAFVAEHHVEQPFYKRKRDYANPEALGRRAPGWQSEDE